MNPKSSIEDLLRWRATQAEAEAPPPPRASRLLELARPWWEKWPEKFQTIADRVNAMPLAYGHAMSAPSSARSGYPVPAVLVCRGGVDFETSARVVFVNGRENRLRLRFQLDAGIDENAPTFDTTFIAEGETQALFSARAVRSVDDEYRIDTDLLPQLESQWAQLKVTDRMPFRLILRDISETDATPLR